MGSDLHSFGGLPLCLQKFLYLWTMEELYFVKCPPNEMYHESLQGMTPEFLQTLGIDNTVEEFSKTGLVFEFAAVY